MIGTYVIILNKSSMDVMRAKGGRCSAIRLCNVDCYPPAFTHLDTSIPPPPAFQATESGLGPCNPRSLISNCDLEQINY